MARSYAGHPPLARLQAELNRLFEEALELGRGELAASGYPPIDVVEREDSILVLAELPGVAPDDCSVEIEADRLTVSGVRRPAGVAQGGASYSCMERERGPFGRSLVLPGPVDAGQADADLTDGVLTVRLPRVRDQRRVHHVPVFERERGEEE